MTPYRFDDDKGISETIKQRFKDKLGDELFNFLEELTKDLPPVYPVKEDK